MRWPWTPKLETRQTQSYSDTYVQALLNSTSGKSLAIPTATAALESCAGAVGRSFMAAEVTGRPIIADALTPSCLELIGRSLIRLGEIVLLIDVTSGGLTLIPADHYDIDGGPHPDSWVYRVTVGGPSGTMTWPAIPASSVLHIRYAVEPSRPWRGNSPLQVAALAGKLSAETINHLADESSGPVGRLLGLPIDGDDESVSGIKTGIAKARGRMVTLETGDWDNVGTAMMDLATKRFGAEPPRALIEQAKVAFAEVVSACGFNPSLFIAGDSASLRESWRLALWGVVHPLSKLVEAEVNAKLDSGINITFQELRASDLSGRARAYGSLVSGGLTPEAAGREAGIQNIEVAPPQPATTGD